MPLSNFIALVKGLSLYPSTYPLPFWRPTTPPIIFFNLHTGSIRYLYSKNVYRFKTRIVRYRIVYALNVSECK